MFDHIIFLMVDSIVGNYYYTYIEREKKLELVELGRFETFDALVLRYFYTSLADF